VHNRKALFSLFIAPDAKNILAPAKSFQGLRNKFVVSPIVFFVVFQFHRQAVWEWAQSIKTDWGEATELIVGGHFPPYRGNSSFQHTNANAERSKSEAVDKFVEAFQWANTLTEFPKEYVDPNDLKSLQVLVKVLRFLKAVPPES
jgi:hypothetical protein